MATMTTRSSLHSILIMISCSLLLLASRISLSTAATSTHCNEEQEQQQQQAPVVEGLSWSFYDNTCPRVESIIRKHLKKAFKDDIGLAAGLLRIHFHDCFVQGCDGSVLLDGTASDPREQQAPPNLSLRPAALQLIDDLQVLIQEKCGEVVSCTDIAALAARDAVRLSSGPNYHVPLGRRDSLTSATQATTSANLPSPFSNATTILSQLSTKGFTPVDVVALSGAHTIGLSHCFSFLPRLYPTVDPTLDPDLASKLKIVCPNTNSTNTTDMDFRTPNTFDNKYFVNLVNRQGLFTSDEDLYVNDKTKEIVESFAEDQDLFFEKFVKAMIKMGQLSVLTGTRGEIRRNCSTVNNNIDPAELETLVEDRVSEGLLRNEL